MKNTYLISMLIIVAGMIIGTGIMVYNGRPSKSFLDDKQVLIDTKTSVAPMFYSLHWSRLVVEF